MSKRSQPFKTTRNIPPEQLRSMGPKQKREQKANGGPAVHGRRSSSQVSAHLPSQPLELWNKRKAEDCLEGKKTMESFPFKGTTPTLFTSPHPFSSHKIPIRLSQIPLLRFPSQTTLHSPTTLLALKSPRGFGPSPNQSSKKKKKKKRADAAEDRDDDEEEEEYRDDTIPEIVTNRMMKRMGLSIGIPLGIGLLFFPFFYYLKVVLKIDVPSWVPVIVSFFFFGSALLGVSYGIVSSSWDPLREGSLLGWNEAEKNWPVFWQSLWGRNKK